jgi:hypothetical protein
MCCDCSAYCQKAIKATAKRLIDNKHSLAVAFFAFWAIRSIAVYFTGIYLLVDLLIYNQRRTLVQ